jgi:ribosome biogenesis protein ERB1
VVWHAKGDYFATMAHNVQSTSQVLIHSLSGISTQKPFTSCKGIIQAMQFHPSRPQFFVATHQMVYQYNLQKQTFVNKFPSGSKWISSMSVHPKGDNFALGTYDKKIIWFDSDMSTEPFKTFKYHNKAIRQVAFAPKYPLFASCSDDGSINVFYSMIFNDILQNPLIVPVKLIKAHEVQKESGLGTMDIKFHPN